ncbi:MAG: hypothetical protein E7774_16285 [Bradyrhizobium sp.]|nr:MAG: hypothetical protein E7774_16285 [Bradyrhizobium sp.]
MNAPAVPRKESALPLRLIALAAGLALAFAAAWLAQRLSPQGGAGAPVILAALLSAAAIGLAASLEAAALPPFAIALAFGALVLLAADFSSEPNDVMASAFGFGALALAGAIAAKLIAARRRKRPALAPFALCAAAAAAIGAYAFVYVALSRELMVSDFIHYREAAIAIAGLADAGRWRALILGFVASMTDDYSWAPALAPGLAMAASAPLSRLAYEASIIILYGAPALLALALLARDLARRAGLRRDFAPMATLTLAAGAAFAAYPTGVAVLARGMPDIGGLIFYVAALRLSERLLRLIGLPPGHDAQVAPLVRRVTAALALCVFAMVLFRRWYAFAALGLALMLALECGLIALRRRANFRWRETMTAGSYGLLLILAFLSPAIVDWLPDPAAHDYAAIYAAYRKPWPIFADKLLDWCGWAVPLAAVASAAWLFARSPDRRLWRLTIGAAAIAAAAFLRVQTPYVHHLYLIAPALTALIGAPLLILFAHRPLFAALALAALVATSLTPYVARLAPPSFAPVAALPPPPRTDLAELARMKSWVEARARPDNRVCGLGSSYAFSGQLIEELWQLDPIRSPLYPDEASRPSVTMSDVDTVQGPPNPELKTCAIMLVGDPVQTHLDSAYQQTVIVPSREMLAGVGIGAHYRRTGEVFHLENNVSAVVFEQISPLDNSDMAALAERWREARKTVAGDLRGPIAP